MKLFTQISISAWYACKLTPKFILLTKYGCTVSQENQNLVFLSCLSSSKVTPMDTLAFAISSDHKQSYCAVLILHLENPPQLFSSFPLTPGAFLFSPLAAWLKKHFLAPSVKGETKGPGSMGQFCCLTIPVTHITPVLQGLQNAFLTITLREREVVLLAAKPGKILNGNSSIKEKKIDWNGHF